MWLLATRGTSKTCRNEITLALPDPTHPSLPTLTQLSALPQSSLRFWHDKELSWRRIVAHGPPSDRDPNLWVQSQAKPDRRGDSPLASLITPSKLPPNPRGFRVDDPRAAHGGANGAWLPGPQLMAGQVEWGQETVDAVGSLGTDAEPNAHHALSQLHVEEGRGWERREHGFEYGLEHTRNHGAGQEQIGERQPAQGPERRDLHGALDTFSLDMFDEQLVHIEPQTTCAHAAAIGQAATPPTALLIPNAAGGRASATARLYDEETPLSTRSHPWWNRVDVSTLD